MHLIITNIVAAIILLCDIGWAAITFYYLLLIPGNKKINRVYENYKKRLTGKDIVFVWIILIIINFIYIL